MPFQKGESGNAGGRPKQTPEEREQREQFLALLGRSTVPALKSIIEIAADRRNRSRLAACKYIVDKAYGANAELLIAAEPVTIRVIPYEKPEDKEVWEPDDWD